MRRAAVGRAAVVLGLVVGSGGLAVAQTPISHAGYDAVHPPSSVLPNEQVDPASGSLAVSGTDLVLPGNAGFDVAIQRVYNSAVYPDYNSGSTAFEEDSWAGIGWRLHFGRVLNPDTTAAGQTSIEMPDGSRHALYHSLTNSNIWTTTDFWIYDRPTHTLKLPNGLIYTFGHRVTLNARLGDALYVTDISDLFGNHVTFSYFSAPGPVDGVASITQYLSPTVTRSVTFAYDPTLKALSSMSYAGRTWYYTQQAAGPTGYSVLTRVQPPAGPAWQYGYSATMTGELTQLTTPSGGQISYVYADSIRHASFLQIRTRVVTQRIVGGRAVTPGTWTFAYDQGSNKDTTVVSCPCGTTSYTFSGMGYGGTFHAWNAGLVTQVVVVQDGVTLETRTMSWVPSEDISDDDIVGQQGVWNDGQVRRPLLDKVITTRGSHTWTVNHNHHWGTGTVNDYGAPWWIQGTGDLVKTTSRVFQSSTTP